MQGRHVLPREGSRRRMLSSRRRCRVVQVVRDSGVGSGSDLGSRAHQWTCGDRQPVPVGEWRPRLRRERMSRGYRRTAAHEHSPLGFRTHVRRSGGAQGRPQLRRRLRSLVKPNAISVAIRSARIVRTIDSSRTAHRGGRQETCQGMRLRRTSNAVGTVMGVWIQALWAAAIAVPELFAVAAWWRVAVRLSDRIPQALKGVRSHHG